MPANQPRKVYRYQRFSTWALQALCHDQLHFADPTDFNDPFDCQPTVEYDSDIATLRQILAKLLGRRVERETLHAMNNVKIKGNYASAHVEKFVRYSVQTELKRIAHYAINPDYDDRNPDYECWLLTNQIQRELLMRYDRGICCFSSTYANPLLWSHYADQHNGLCVGYNLDREPKPILQKVEYGGSRTVKTSLIAKAYLDNNKTAQENLDHNILLRKAPAWRYEKEWRLFGSRGIQDSTLALKDVTFGLRCPDAIIHSIIAAFETRDPKIQFYEVCEVRGSFKLKRRKVDTGEMRIFLPNTARSGLEIFGPVDDEDPKHEPTISSE
jgi:hypothetical protein